MNKISALFTISLITAIPLLAEKAPMYPEGLYHTATHVLSGKVNRIYQRVDTTGNYRYTRYAAEIRVGNLEKGDRIESGALIYVRYWRRNWIGTSMAPQSTSGHRGLPNEGDLIRVYLARNAYDGFGTTSDGGFNVIGANGFEILERNISDSNNPSRPEKESRKTEGKFNLEASF